MKWINIIGDRNLTLASIQKMNHKIISKLQKYMSALSKYGNPVENYHKNYDIFREIWSLKYLRCSDNPKIRELLHQLELLSSGIYNTYMTECR